MIYFSQIKLEKGKPRPAETYRGARRNADREDAAYLKIREHRKSLGLSRRQYEAWKKAQAAA